MPMYKYKCYLCGQIIHLPYNQGFVRYWCEVKQKYTKIYRTK